MSDHSKLAPVLCDFIPKGRTAQDVALYKLMRRSARLHRQDIWESAAKVLTYIMLHGVSYVRVKWDRGDEK